MKATDLLKNQHREVEELFRQLEGAEEERERMALRESLANALAAHASIEEEIFYPAAMEALGPSGRIREGLEEHAIAEFALYRLLQVSPMDETFSAKVASLKELIMNHVEEEESEILPQAEGEIERERLEMLGERLEARFEEKMAEGHRAILEQNLGIIARGGVVTPETMPEQQAQQQQRRPATKKTSPARRTTQKRATGTAKRGASKRGATTQAKRGSGSTQAKRGGSTGTAKRGAATQSRSTRKTSTTQSARGQGGSSRTQKNGSSARGGASRSSSTQRGGASTRKRAASR